MRRRRTSRGDERVNSDAFSDAVLASSRFLVDSEAMRPDARAWFEHRTTSAASLAELDLDALLRAKRRGGHRVSVVLPARNEAATVGRLVADLHERWVRRLPLVDELLVMDSDSTDATAAVARAAGADVVATTDVLPAHGSRPGKGEALWKSLAATTGDLVVFLDADLLGDVAHYVPGLLGPLLTEPQVAYVKGCYTRPLRDRRPGAAGRRRPGHRADRPSAAQRAVAGARRVRPAARRRVRRPPLGPGAGAVRLRLRRGGRAAHRPAAARRPRLARPGRPRRPPAHLAVARRRSARWPARWSRAARSAARRPARIDASGLLTQFRHDGVGFVPRSTAVAVDERPPMDDRRRVPLALGRAGRLTTSGGSTPGRVAASSGRQGRIAACRLLPVPLR